MVVHLQFYSVFLTLLGQKGFYHLKYLEVPLHITNICVHAATVLIQKNSSSLLRLHGHQIRKLWINSMIYLYNQQICVGSLYVICFSDRCEKCLTESFLDHKFRHFRIATLKFFLHKIKLILYHSSMLVLIKTFAHTVKMCLTCFWGIISIDTISMFRSTFVFIKNKILKCLLLHFQFWISTYIWNLDSEFTFKIALIRRLLKIYK